MNFTGLIVGAATFLIIGVFHPIVIKVEYYWGKKMWPIFLFFGLIVILTALMTENDTVSVILGVLAFSSFWSIGELKDQEERVRKGWFPANPNKKL